MYFVGTAKMGIFDILWPLLKNSREGTKNSAYLSIFGGLKTANFMIVAPIKLQNRHCQKMVGEDW